MSETTDYIANCIWWLTDAETTGDHRVTALKSLFGHLGRPDLAEKVGVPICGRMSRTDENSGHGLYRCRRRPDHDGPCNYTEYIHEPGLAEEQRAFAAERQARPDPASPKRSVKARKGDGG